MAGKLPRVTEYIKNVGKSVGYASLEVVKEPTENISDFLDTNSDLFKTIYSATRNYKDTMKVVNRSIKNSKIYEAAEFGFKALKDDLRTGKFYNKERETQAEMSAFGDDFADFSDFDDVDFGSNWGANDDKVIEQHEKEPPPAIKAITQTSAGLSSVIAASSQAQSGVIISSAEALSNTQIASTKLLSAQNEKINASIISGFSGVNAGIGLVASILSGPMTSYMNESTRFYGDVSSKLSETNAYLKEMAEMQRNLYKAQEQEWKTSKYDEVVSASGMPDITAYAKRIYKNIMDLDPTGGMLQGDKDENIFKMFVGSPLKAIPTMIAKMIVPATVTKTLQTFDQNMSGLFASFIARMNSWADEDAFGDGINFRGIIGRLLGIKIGEKTSVDTSRFHRGPIPFDGETKKAIVDVIPAYLARIESAISGMPERIYDGKSGKFRTVRDIHKDYRNLMDSGARSSISSIEDDFEKWAREWIGSDRSLKSDSERNDRYRTLRAKFDELGRTIYRNGGDFRPFEGYGPKGERRYEDTIFKGDFSDLEWSSFMRALSKNKKAVYDIASNSIGARQRINRQLEAAEEGFMNPYAALFDGRLSSIKDGRMISFDPNSRNYYAKDSKFRSATDYLKDILAEVRYIRMYGGRGKSGKGSGLRPDFNNFKSSFDNEYSEDIPVKERDLSWYIDEQARREDERKANMSDAERYGLTVEGLAETSEAARKTMNSWANMRKKVDELLKSPAKWVTDIIHKADERIFKAMFGDESGETFKDKRGFEYQSFLDYLVGRTGQIFDDFRDKMKSTWNTMMEKFKKTAVGKWVTEKGGAFARQVGEKLKDRFGMAKSRFSRAMGNTYGNLIHRMRRGEVLNAEDFEYGGSTYDSTSGINDYDDMTDLLEGLNQNSAYGRIVNKYGLSMLSPGEIVIPNPLASTRRKNLAGEKREKSRIMKAIKGGRFSHNAEGTIAQNNKEESSIIKAIKKVMGEVSGDGAGIAADALIGGGVSLITGMVGGPLLGAAAGAGIGLVRNSETLQKKLFGDENHKGGLIPKKVTEFFQKNSDGMIDFGAAGAIAGLFTPLGLVGGALAGATLGFTKNTKWFQDMMFGNEIEGKTGLMSPETKKKLEKALPAMGIGAGAGILLGPFGLIGNAVLGSAAGYVATSDKFKEMILGKEGEDGKKQGGLAGALKTGLIEPLTDSVLGKKGSNGKREGGIIGDVTSFFKESVLNPIQNIVETSGMVIKNTFVSLGDRISDAISGVFAKHVGMPMEEWFREKVFKRVSGVLSTIMKGAVGIAKFAIKAPLMPLNAVANSVKAKQIGRGTRDNMTAQQRMDFRNKHKIRFGRMGAMGTDNTRDLDMMLAGMNESQLESFTGNLNTFINNQGANKIAYFDQLRGVGNNLSAYFDDNNLWGKQGYNLKKKIIRALEQGKYDEVRYIMNRFGITPEQQQEILGMINIDSLSASRDNMIQESGLTKEAIKQIESSVGMSTFTTKRGARANMRRMLRLGKTELKARKAANRIASGTSEEVTEEEMSPVEQVISQSNRSIITALVSINNNLASIGKNPNATVIRESNGVVTVTPAHPLSNEDGIEATQAREAEEKRDKNIETIAEALSEGNGLLNRNNEPGEDTEEGEKKSLLSRLFGMLSGSNTGSKLMTILGGAGKTVGIAAAVTGGITLLGYASEYFKPLFNSVADKITNSELFQTIKTHVVGFAESIKDGSFFVSMASKVSQGIGYAMKNVVGPLTHALVSTFPDLLAGIAKGVWTGIKSWFGKETVTNNSDYAAHVNAAMNSMPIGNDEAAIAAEFGGSSYKYGSVKDTTSSGSVNYKPGKYHNRNGSTSTTNDYGITTVYDNNGKMIGSYDSNTGDIVTTSMTEEKASSGLSGIINSFKRGFATGKTPAVAQGINALAKKFISNESIAKSATRTITGGKNPLSIFGRIGSGIATTVKSGIRAVTGASEAAGTVGSGLTNLLQNGKNTVTNLVSKIQDNVLDKAINVSEKAGDNILGKAIKNGAEAAVSAATKLDGLAAKIISFGTKLADSKVVKWIFDKLKKGTTKLISEEVVANKIINLFKKIAPKVAQEGTEKLAKVTAKVVAGVTPISIAFWLTSLVNGFTKTESLLGVTKDSGLELGVGARVITAIVHALNENLLLGLIPTETLFGWVIPIFEDICGFSKEDLEAAQKISDEIITNAGLESGDTVTLEEYNKQQGLLSKGWNAIKNLVTGNKNTKVTYDSKSTATTTARKLNTRGRGRGGQQGGIYSGMRYGNSTIGEAGCAPVAAAKLLGSGVPEAARYAQMTGHVAPDGSTDIGFFNDYFSAKGISNRTTTSKREVDNALKNGQSAIMLGRDPGGGYDSAYSNSSHYITARAGRNGQYIVDDPALGRRVMSKNKVMRNMKASVITGRGRNMSRFRGKGSLTGGMTGTEYLESTSRGATGPARILSIAKAEAEKGYAEKSDKTTKYGIAAGNPTGHWCCFFVWWIFRQAGASEILYDGKVIGRCTTLMNWFRNRGQEVSTPKAGDIIFFNFNNPNDRSAASHVGIVSSYIGGKLKTIEGNTSAKNSGSQDNGDGVYEKTRSFDYVVSICRPAYSNADFSDALPYIQDGYYNYSSGEVENGSMTLFSEIANAGKAILKGAFGGLYDALFGDNSTDDGTYTGDTNYPSNVTSSGDLSGNGNAQKIWKYLRSKGYSEAGTAAIMGSLYRESGLNPNNVQNSYESKVGDDVTYTNKINNKSYSRDKFEGDSAGYGLAQWTYHSRKKNLYDATIGKGIKIDDLKSQLEFLDKEISDYGLSKALKSATNISEANKTFIAGYEKPAGYENPSNSLYSRRLESAKSYYNQFKGTGRGYANRVNTNYVNGKARDDISTGTTVMAGSGSVSYTVFLETIITILMSISDNTDTLTKILDILSQNFNINVSKSDVSNATSRSSNKAKDALRQLMTDRSNANDVANILQSKNTGYLIEAMTRIAQE